MGEDPYLPHVKVGPKMPDTHNAELTLSLAESLASLQPVAGGPLVSLLDAAFRPMAEKRQRKYIETLAAASIEIQGMVPGLTVEQIVESDVFFSTAVAAGQVAMRQHHQEKFDALHNILVHAGLPGAVDDGMQLYFVNLVDVLTPCEMHLLTLFCDFRRFGLDDIHQLDYPKGSAKDFAVERIPCLKDRGYLYDHYLFDLVNHGLLDIGDRVGDGGAERTRINTPRPTDIGMRFFEHISEAK
jgi:hypothetical protein